MNLLQLAKIDDDIKYAVKRIDMAKNEKILPNANPYIAQYISELNKDLDKLKSERALLAKATATHELTEFQIQLIRDQLKDFSNRNFSIILLIHKNQMIQYSH